MRRALVAFGATLALFAFDCGGGDDITYGPEGDVRIVGQVEGTWVSDDGKITLTLCEDRTAGAKACNGHAIADVGSALSTGYEQSCHVIRGDGSGATESLPRGGGCDSPDPFASMAVRVDRDGATSSEFPLRGWVDVHVHGDDPYAGPLEIWATSEAPRAAASLQGEGFEHDVFTASLSQGRASTPVVEDASIRDGQGDDAYPFGEDAGEDASLDASTSDATASDASLDASFPDGSGDAAGVSAPADASAPDAPPSTDGGASLAPAMPLRFRRTVGPSACHR